MSYDISKLLEIARAEQGYCEKRSNSQLDSKTANAGSANITKYWRDLYPAYQGESYCDCFVKWCFYKAYGKSAANTLTCGGLYSFYTPSSAQLYKNKGQWHTGSDVKRGDQIFFKNSQRIHHTGIVSDVKNGRIYTIEGNTSNGDAVVPNGGMVCAKSYPIGLSTIAGYGRPNYGIQTTTNEDGFDYHQVYDDAYYKAKYPDIAKAYGSKNAYEHFVKYGLDEFRQACSWFDPKFYKEHNPDVAKNFGGRNSEYYKHYITYVLNGNENRKGSPTDDLSHKKKAATSQKTGTGTVTTTLNVRTGAGTNYSKCQTFGPLKAGSKVTILKTVKGDAGDTWYFVEYNGKKGYCDAKYIK